MADRPYPKSNMPPARSTTGPAADKKPAIPSATWYDRSRAVQAERNRGRAIVAPDSRFVEYPSMRQFEVLTIPRSPSDLRQGAFDQVKALDLPRHIVSRTREGFRIGPAEAAATLGHYVGTVKGLNLFDAASQSGFESAAQKFVANPSEESLLAVEQYLNGLVPSERGEA